MLLPLYADLFNSGSENKLHTYSFSFTIHFYPMWQTVNFDINFSDPYTLYLHYLKEYRFLPSKTPSILHSESVRLTVLLLGFLQIKKYCTGTCNFIQLYNVQSSGSGFFFSIVTHFSCTKLGLETKLYRILQQKGKPTFYEHWTRHSWCILGN